MCVLCLLPIFSFIYFILDDSIRINLHLLIKVREIAIIIFLANREYSDKDKRLLQP